MADQATPAPPEPRTSEERTTPETEQVNILAARLRMGEERYTELRKKLLVVEQNMLTNHKKAMNEIKTLQGDFSELKRTIQAVEDKIITIIKELRLTARKEDIDVMRRYLELWDPVKFITNDQVERIIDEKLGMHTEEKHEQEDTRADKPVNYDSPT